MVEQPLPPFDNVPPLPVKPETIMPTAAEIDDAVKIFEKLGKLKLDAIRNGVEFTVPGVPEELLRAAAALTDNDSGSTISAEAKATSKDVMPVIPEHTQRHETSPVKGRYNAICTLGSSLIDQLYPERSDLNRNLLKNILYNWIYNHLFARLNDSTNEVKPLNESNTDDIPEFPLLRLAYESEAYIASMSYEGATTTEKSLSEDLNDILRVCKELLDYNETDNLPHQVQVINPSSLNKNFDFTRTQKPEERVFYFVPRGTIIPKSGESIFLNFGSGHVYFAGIDIATSNRPLFRKTGTSTVKIHADTIITGGIIDNRSENTQVDINAGDIIIPSPPSKGETGFVGRINITAGNRLSQAEYGKIRVTGLVSARTCTLKGNFFSGTDMWTRDNPTYHSKLFVTDKLTIGTHARITADSISCGNLVMLYSDGGDCGRVDLSAAFSDGSIVITDTQSGQPHQIPMSSDLDHKPSDYHLKTLTEKTGTPIPGVSYEHNS